MLIVFGGLPGVGKTTIAREVARAIGAVHLRIDTIEYAIRQSSLPKGPIDDAGYCVAYAVAEDNLRLGRMVLGDSVNPLPVTRQAWRGVASRAGVGLIEIEVTCSDAREHQRRVESRGTDFPGWTLEWREVVERDYHPWDRDRVLIDTAGATIADCVDRAVAAIRSHTLSG
jgi:predicted kinase